MLGIKLPAVFLGVCLSVWTRLKNASVSHRQPDANHTLSTQKGLRCIKGFSNSLPRCISFLSVFNDFLQQFLFQVKKCLNIFTPFLRGKTYFPPKVKQNNHLKISRYPLLRLHPWFIKNNQPFPFKWVKIMENPMKMDDLGVPPFKETSKFTQQPQNSPKKSRRATLTLASSHRRSSTPWTQSPFFWGSRNWGS